MIKKADALAKMTAKDEADYRAVEQRCDEALAKYNGGSINVEVEGFSEKAIDRIIAAYSAPEMGWTVTKHHGDQRDPGPWLTFK